VAVSCFIGGGKNGENHQVTDKLYHIMLFVWPIYSRYVSTIRRFSKALNFIHCGITFIC
jgi:hypothetical protein